jgi:enolase
MRLDTEISSIIAREIFDSRAIPTVEVEITSNTGVSARAAVPSGASTGKYEAYELRDGKPRLAGRGVETAVMHIQRELAPLLIGRCPLQQLALDQLLCQIDGSSNKQRLGANAILAVSLAIAKLAALLQEQPLYIYLQQLYAGSPCRLPVPMVNLINGGMHADNGLDIQEFMIVPHAFAGNISATLEVVAEITMALKTILKRASLATTVGDEGGFAPCLTSNRAALDLLMQAITAAGYQPGKQVSLALDLASTAFYDADKQTYAWRLDKQEWDSSGYLEHLVNLVAAYPIISLEDAMAEEDWPAWQALTARLGKQLQLVGDDLFVTNYQLLKQGITQQVANAILIKPNQIGTVSETLDTMRLAQAQQYQCVVSHRSGETEDTFIADLAVATAAGQIKTGAMMRGERVCKYNQLLRIAEHMSHHT